MPAAMNVSRLIGSPLRAGSRGSTPAKRLASTKPLPPRRQLPAALHGVARVPAHPFVLHVPPLVMGVEQFDAVTVRIAHIDEERVAGTMAAGPEFDIGGKAHLGGEIADVEEVIGFRDRERGVMEPRPCPGGEDDIVRVALALQE